MKNVLLTILVILSMISKNVFAEDNMIKHTMHDGINCGVLNPDKKESQIVIEAIIFSFLTVKTINECLNKVKNTKIQKFSSGLLHKFSKFLYIKTTKIICTIGVLEPKEVYVYRVEFHKDTPVTPDLISEMIGCFIGIKKVMDKIMPEQEDEKWEKDEKIYSVNLS